jgi:hypothetical protein
VGIIHATLKLWYRRPLNTSQIAGFEIATAQIANNKAGRPL